MNQYTYILLFLTGLCFSLNTHGYSQEPESHLIHSSLIPGQLWPDGDGNHINVYGGGVIFHDGNYFWIGEHKGENSNAAWVGVTCYASGDYIRIEPDCHNEPPAIFKKDGRYFMITSGCTGWEPNAARLLVADNIWGRWILYPNPCIGNNAHLTFFSQSTFVLPVQGLKDAFIFFADQWRPKNPVDGRYVWLPIEFINDLPVIKWYNSWAVMEVFD